MDTNLRVVLYGGDAMLGRGVQLSLPVQARGEEYIADSLPAWHYLFQSMGWRIGFGFYKLGVRYSKKIAQELALRRIQNEDGRSLWNDCLAVKMSTPPDIRILNLETAVTSTINNFDVFDKLNYHMHCDNISHVFKSLSEQTFGSEKAAPYVVCVANNHTIDFGRKAFREETLPAYTHFPGNAYVLGAGATDKEAFAPLSLSTRDKRIEIAAFTTEDAGTPRTWKASGDSAGLAVLPELNSDDAVIEAFDLIAGSFKNTTEQGRCARLISIHWGPNWAQGNDNQLFRQRLAYRLIDELGVDLIYGHSSHHIRGMEVYKDKLIIYGAGEFVNDYESFIQRVRPKYDPNGAMFVVDIAIHTGHLTQLLLVPFCMKKLQVTSLIGEEAYKLTNAINHHSAQDSGFGTPVVLKTRQFQNEIDTDTHGEKTLLYFNPAQ